MARLSPVTRISRVFWRMAMAILPPHSALGRIVKTRGVKKPISNLLFFLRYRRLLGVCRYFPSETQILFLGSSHINTNVDPTAFATLQAWNAAIPSGDLRTAHYLYQYFRLLWPQHPGQCVVLGEDFWLFAHTLEYTPDFFFCAILHRLIALPYRSALLMKRWDLLAERADRFFAMRANDTSLQPKGRGHRRLFGHALPPGKEDKEAAQVRAQRHLRFRDFAPTELPYLAQLRQAVEADGRKLILLRPPYRQDYRQVLGEVAALWQPFRPYEAGLQVLDDTDLILDDTVWYDPDHLNAQGAIAYTQHLERNLLAVLAERPR